MVYNSVRVMLMSKKTEKPKARKSSSKRMSVYKAFEAITLCNDIDRLTNGLEPLKLR